MAKNTRKRTVRIEVTDYLISRYRRKYFNTMEDGYWLERLDDGKYRSHMIPWFVHPNGDVLPELAGGGHWACRYAHPVIRDWCSDGALWQTFPEMLGWCRDQQKQIQRVTLRPNLRAIDFVFKNTIDATLFKLFFG